MAMMNTAAQLARLPHRDPFRFVSEIDVMEPGRGATARWVVSGKEDFLRGHFPEEPIVPGVLIGEALAQLSGLVALADSSKCSHARLGQIDIKFVGTVRPPAEIKLESALTRTLEDLSVFDVRATSGGTVVAHGSLILSFRVEVPQ